MRKQAFLTKVDLNYWDWTDKSIKYFLITPDKLIKHASKSLPMFLYSLGRVKEIESSSDFDTYNQWRIKIKAIYLKSRDAVISCKINIPILEQDLLYQKACKHWYVC